MTLIQHPHAFWAVLFQTWKARLHWSIAWTRLAKAFCDSFHLAVDHAPGSSFWLYQCWGPNPNLIQLVSIQHYMQVYMYGVCIYKYIYDVKRMILANMLKSFLSRSLSHKQVTSHNDKVIQPWMPMLSNPSSTLPGWVRNDCRSKSEAENEEKFPPFLVIFITPHSKGRNPVETWICCKTCPSMSPCPTKCGTVECLPRRNSSVAWASSALRCFVSWQQGPEFIWSKGSRQRIYPVDLFGKAVVHQPILFCYVCHDRCNWGLCLSNLGVLWTVPCLQGH